MKNIAALLTLVIVGSLPLLKAQLWSGAIDLGDNWKYVEWFGIFYAEGEEAGWLYYPDIGWMYAAGDTQENIAFYLGDAGYAGMVGANDWFFSGENLFPWHYSNALSKWYYFNNEGLNAYPLNWYSHSDELWLPLERIGYEVDVNGPLPDGYRLTKSVVFIRHGERTPEANFGTKNERLIQPQFPSLGELTPQGQREELFLGSVFRTRLVHQTGLLSASVNSSTTPSPYYALAADAQRCVTSAEYFLAGLLDESPDRITVPANKPENFPENYFSFESNNAGQRNEADNIEGQIDGSLTLTNPSLAILKQNHTNIENAFANEPTRQTSDMTVWNANAGWPHEQNGRVIQPAMQSASATYVIADLLEYIWIANDTFADGFTAQTVDEAWFYTNTRDTIVYNNQQLAYYDANAQLTSLFNNALNNLEPDGTGNDNAKLYLFCGHDGNLWPIVGSLGNLLPVQNPAVDIRNFTPSLNPYFASFLEISVYEISGVSGITDSTYVQLNYNGRVLNLSAIADESSLFDNKTLVTLSAFQSYLRNGPSSN